MRRFRFTFLKFSSAYRLISLLFNEKSRLKSQNLKRSRLRKFWAKLFKKPTKCRNGALVQSGVSKFCRSANQNQVILPSIEGKLRKNALCLNQSAFSNFALYVINVFIVSSVEAVLSRQRDLSEPVKDNIRSRIASTLQSASLPDNNLTNDERQALKRLKTDKDIVILPADKGRVTVVMDQTDYHDKMNELVNDKQTYEELKRDPTPALQRKLNSKLLKLKKTDAIDIRRYYRLRCRVPQPPKRYGLPKLHKPNIPMRPIVSFCGSPTYQLSKYLTTVLQPLTDQSRHKLQSTENFIDAIKTAQIPDDHRLVSFDVKSLFTSIPLQLALDCTETAITTSTVKLPLPTDDIMDLLNLCLTSTYFQYNGKHYKQLHGTAMGSPVSVVVAEIVMQNIEELALSTYTKTLPLWLRYVDDTFTAVHKDKIDTFHEHLTNISTDRQNPHIHTYWWDRQKFKYTTDRTQTSD